MGQNDDIRKRKRARFVRPAGRRRPPLPVPLLVLVGIALLTGAAILLGTWIGGNGPSTAGSAAPAPAQVADTAGTIRLPLAAFDDGRARFYTYQHQDISVEYFVLRSNDGVVRAALNACDVCYPARRGYRQEGDEMVCNNCGQRFPSVRINEVSGGCNPAPLDRTIEGDELVIHVDDLISASGYFQ